MAWWVFQNLVVIAGLSLVVVAVCRASRLGPVARHALWVLVLVKFVTPPFVVWPWTVPDPLGLTTSHARTDRRSIAPVVEPWAQAPGDAMAVTVLPAVSRADADGPSEFVRSATPWLPVLWIAGSLLMLGLEGVRFAQMARRVREGRPVPAAIIDRVRDLSARLGLKPVPITAVAGCPSPAVWGVVRPRLLWPLELTPGLTEACIDGLLVHELAHVKRRDHVVGWIDLAAGVAWWWNPLFWYTRSALREQAELACDAWVVSTIPNGRRAYAESLLALSGPEARPRPPAAVVGIRAVSRRVLERRLVMIMKGCAPVRLPRVGMVSLALVAIAALPAWATAPRQTPPPPKPVPVYDFEVVSKAQTKPQPAKPNTTAVPKTVEIKPDITVVQQTMPAKPRVVVRQGPKNAEFVVIELTNLTADGEKLVQNFDADRAAIQAEADAKLAARREALTTALKELQDRYAKEGKLDEAVAIRNYLRAGLPGLDGKRPVELKRK